MPSWLTYQSKAMKRYLLLLPAGLFLIGGLRAQSMQAVGLGVFSGAMGVDENPAMMAASPYKLDIIPFGVNAFGASNQVAIRKSGGGFEQVSLTGQGERYADLLVEFKGPSAIYRIDDSQTIGFSTRFRLYTNIDGLTDRFGDDLATEFDDPAYFNNPASNQSAFVRQLGWQEFGFSYARVLFENDRFRIKGGATLKFLLGTVASHIQVTNLSYNTLAEDQTFLTNYDLDIRFANGMEDLQTSADYNLRSSLGLGGDIGGVVEFYSAGAKGEDIISITEDETEVSKGIDKVAAYKLRFGLALRDIGRVTFNNGNYSASSSFNGNTLVDIEEKFDTDNIEEFYDSLASISPLSDVGGKLRVGLPTTLQADLDFNIGKGFYANAVMSLDMSGLKSSDFYVKRTSFYGITPRWEIPKWGLYLPVVMNSEGEANLGFAARLFPVVVGIHDILPLFSRDEIRSTGAYFLIRIPIRSKRYGV